MLGRAAAALVREAEPGFRPSRATSVFTPAFFNANLFKLAICAPPRQAAMRRDAEVFITELGAAAPSEKQQAVAG
jgi:hypothetical protein